MRPRSWLRSPSLLRRRDVLLVRQPAPAKEVGHLLDEALRAFVRERVAMCAAISKTGKARAAAIK